MKEEIESLIEALEAKDPNIREHLEGVRRVALRLGRRLALPEESLNELSTAAVLHDVGKVRIPDGILRKPGPLTDEEYETMKRHPALGAGIVARSEALSPALPVVRHHHERFDGGGYPDGLRGEDIPLSARIVAVADAFDSMIRDRTYDPGIPPEAAITEIEANAGTQFDPRVVAALSGLDPGEEFSG